MKKDLWILGLLIIGVVFVNYGTVDSFLIRSFEDIETGVIERVVDGDTIVVNGEKIRMLGINTPEKGEWLYSEAGDFLKEYNGSSVRLEFGTSKFDRYGRKLAYVFSEGVNLNLEIIRNGYGNPYFPSGKDAYYGDFYSAWEECMVGGLRFCGGVEEECLEVDWKPKEEIVEFREKCGRELNLNGWTIKDEGRKKFVFSGRVLEGFGSVVIDNEDFGEDYVWTRSGDSIFVRNDDEGLVYFERY